MTEIFSLAVVGATGNLGNVLLPKLTYRYHVTVIMCKSLTADFPTGENITVVKVSDHYPVNELIPIFKEQHAVICAVSPRVSVVRYNTIINAAVDAGVIYFIPAEFGLDTTDLATAKVVPPILEESAIIDELKKVSTNSSMTWTAIGTEWFLDWGLKVGVFRIDMVHHQAFILGNGNTRFSTTTINDVAESVFHVLLRVEERPEDVIDKFIFVQTFNITRHETIKGLERVTGRTWKLEHTDEAEFLRECEEKLARGELEGLLARSLLSVSCTAISRRSKAMSIG